MNKCINIMMHCRELLFIFLKQISSMLCNGFFLKMKITTFLIIAGLQVSANVMSQEISLKVKNARLKEVLSSIRKQTGYHLVYNTELISSAKLVTVDLHKLPLQQVMTLLFTDQPFDYELQGKTILIKPKAERSKIRMDESIQAQIIAKGNVTDANDKPLAGVTVKEKGTNNGTVTSETGTFRLSVKDAQSVLVFSYIGYVSTEKQASAQMNIKLEENASAMDEVVVVGYGTQKKINLTGSVSTVSAKQLESRPVQNLGQALQGMVPGLNLQTSGLGGELNQTMSVNIRGAGTIGVGSSSSVLVLIDGMEGDMNAINPQDIENISVLKDAASAAIYGSRAPFGVILITTKAGKIGKPVVNYNNNIRLSAPRGLPTMLDSKTFAYYYNEVAANDGEGAKFSQATLDKIIAYQNGEINTVSTPAADGKWQYYTGSNANTNWFEEFYKNFSTSHEHTMSVNGGSDRVKYNSSLNYMDQNGLNKFANDNFKRFSFATKLDIKISDKLDLLTNTRFVREDFDKATHMNDLYYHNIARRWPTVPVRDDNGFYSEPSEINQLIDGGRTNYQKDYLYQQVQLKYQPIKGWNITGNVNYRIINRNDHGEILKAYAYTVNKEPFLVPVGYNSAGGTSVGETAQKDEYFSTNLFSDYSFNIAEDHQFTVLAGFNSELNKYRTLSGTMSGLITDDIPTLNTATLDPKTNGGYQHWAIAGFFSRVNYSYKDRYLLELNARYDGSSRFPTDLRWNLFPSFSAGWNISNEAFWPLKSEISLFKIRGSYGELGNQGTDNWYPFYSIMPVTAGQGSWLLNGVKPNSASAPNLISSSLTWERVSSWNLGLDVAALNNRLGLAFDIYKRNTYDMIGPAPDLPAILGTAVPRINNSEMYSKGFEVELSWKDDIGDFNYGVRAVLSDDQQTITKYPNSTGNFTQWYNGKKNGEIWGYTTLGIAQTQEQMDAHIAHTKQSFATKWQAGDVMYLDKNGDGQVNNGANTLANPGDMSIIGNNLPRFRYSLDLTANYKGFDVRVFLQGIGKRDHVPNGPYFWGANGGMWQSAGFQENMDFFRDENSVMVQNNVLGINQDAYLPRPYFNTQKNQQTQTRYLQNAAYLRLKNAQLGYTFGPSLLSKIGLSKLRVYASGENLLTFTKMAKVFDPETVGLGGWNDGKSYPFSTIYSFGLSVNF